MDQILEALRLTDLSHTRPTKSPLWERKRLPRITDAAVSDLVGAVREIAEWMGLDTENLSWSADTSADSGTISGQHFREPRNDDILQLAAHLFRRPDGVSMKASALEYTNYDEKRAQTLLRGLRRYPRFHSLAQKGG